MQDLEKGAWHSVKERNGDAQQADQLPCTCLCNHSVFRTYNIEREYDTMEEQLSRLDETIRANVMKQQPGQMTAAL